MRYPLWALNSTLFILVVCVSLFIFFSREEVPEREDIKPGFVVIRKNGIPKIDIKQIYEYDLFGTYQKEIIEPEEPKYVVPLPEPPSPIIAQVPSKPEPTFLDPLAITLKGIMSIGDGEKNKAIIQDNKTNREAIYKVGDKIEDAQLIRIFNNKIIFVRSNGQQEVFYLRKSDAAADPTYLIIDDWQGVVRKIVPNNYHIYKEEFTERIKNLAQFIDVLNLTTAYKQGVSVGCRIGSSAANSLVHELGFKEGDIILTINGIPATDTKNRLSIYKMVTGSGLGDEILVRLQRQAQHFTFRYTIADFAVIKKSSGPGEPITMHYIETEREKMLKNKYRFASTAREIRKQERRNMLKMGKKPYKK